MEAFPAWGSGAAASGIGGGGAGGGLGSGSSAKEEFLAWAFDKDGVRISTWAGAFFPLLLIKGLQRRRCHLISSMRPLAATARQDQLATAFFVPADAFESFYLSPTFSASAERDHVLGFPMREFKVRGLLRCLQTPEDCVDELTCVSHCPRRPSPFSPRASTCQSASTSSSPTSR